MKELVDFIVEYWQYFSIALVVVLDIVLIFIKKRSKVDIYDASAYSHLITLIEEAENFVRVINGIEYPLSGPEKLKYVLDHYFSLTGLKNDSWNRASVALMVERILKMPTKKGGYGREEDVKKGK